MNIIEFAFVGYPVTDLHKARVFYEEILGFAPQTTWVEGEKGWIEYEVGPHTLAITNMGGGWEPSPHGPAVALEVADFDEAIRHLKDRDVPFSTEPMDSPVCRLAVISDPDGNKIAIHKRHPAGQ